MKPQVDPPAGFSRLKNQSIDLAVGGLAIAVDVPRRDSAVARGPEPGPQVVAFTNVLKLIPNGKSIDARARWRMSKPKPAEGSRTVPIRSDARWQRVRVFRNP